MYDFGVSDAGVCRLTVNAAAGQQIQLRHAEQLLDGRFYLDNCWFPYESRSWDYYKHIVHLDTYTCREGEQSYTPTFVYHGFRYVKVTGITAQQATPELLTYVVMHSALRSRGGFACSDETVNQAAGDDPPQRPVQFLLFSDGLPPPGEEWLDSRCGTVLGAGVDQFCRREQLPRMAAQYLPGAECRGCAARRGSHRWLGL